MNWCCGFAAEAIPDEYYTIEIGKAKVVRPGQALSVITYGMGVHWALKVCKEEGIDAEILDLRTLLPLDYDAISETVKKTNRAILLHEDTMTGGIGGEIAAWISENLFEHLDAPVLRAAALDTPVPFAIPLEQNFMPVERFRQQVKRLAAY